MAKANMTIGRSKRVANAPDCSSIQVDGQHWCRFPYCGFPQPKYSPWPFPSLDPDHPTFPPPSWTPNWNLTESTSLVPGYGKGYFTPKHPWGLVNLDWTTAQDLWHTGSRNSTNCTAVSVEGCRRLKAAGKAQKCFIYHNWELALEWIERQRAVMYDEAKSNWFMRWPNGTIYAHNIAPGDQYFWNYSNPAAADYVVSSTLMDLRDPAVDG